ncbi:MAG: class I SAM-dependent methyltransferase [Methylovirgula sp.]
MLLSWRKSAVSISADETKAAGRGSIPRPIYDIKVGTVGAVSHVVPPGQMQWYPPVMIGAETLRARIFAEGHIEATIRLIERLTPDDYTSFLLPFYREGLRRFGAGWRYADIVTVLLCLADYLKPQSYLEIGVRRGRSVAAVASICPDSSLTMLDMWVPDYAGMPNPGPDFVRDELKKIGHVGPTAFIDGDSHKTLPELFGAQPDVTFDLITVDGDHSLEGAAMDLCAVLPRINIGGAIVFDDICHPLHPELAQLWHDLVASDTRYSAFSFADAGYGVGFAIKKY